MKNKICIVTGATSGIGLETAKALAQKKYHIVMACRNVEKARHVRENIIDQTGNNDISVIELDLSSLSSIDSFVSSFKSRFDRLDVLINNAGVYSDKQALTKEGFELTIGVNFIGAYYLTQKLLPIIKTTPKARIVNVSSIVGLTYGKKNAWDFYDIEYGYKSYKESKLAQILFTIELAKWLENDDVTVNVLHPGIVGTNIWSGDTLLHKVTQPLMKLIFCSPKKGAQTTIYLATSDEVEGISGKMFANNKIINYKKGSLDEELRHKLMVKTQQVISEVNKCNNIAMS
jgi:NAD(P)-dependent dehydrogenase (short-subunit alcohol dehydrogenase family)